LNSSSVGSGTDINLAVAVAVLFGLLVISISGIYSKQILEI